MARPVIKWAGGKRQILEDIVSLLPEDFRERRYHEPFLGGGALLFWLEPSSGTANDLNPKLMNMYVVLRDHVELLIEDLRTHDVSEEHYYKARQEYNELVLSDWFALHVKRGLVPETQEDLRLAVRLASLLIYLNRTAYNGLYRENSRGEFNVPFGRYRNPKILDEERLRAASRVLKRVKLLCSDFSYVLGEAREGDLVYLDPPYQPVSRTSSFTSYTSEGFSFEDQVRLRDTCLELDRRGVLFILSNSHTEEILRLYEGFRVVPVKARRSINSKADKRGPITEVLITNVPEEMSLGREKARNLVRDRDSDRHAFQRRLF